MAMKVCRLWVCADENGGDELGRSKAEVVSVIVLLHLVELDLHLNEGV